MMFFGTKLKFAAAILTTLAVFGVSRADQPTNPHPKTDGIQTQSYGATLVTATNQLCEASIETAKSPDESFPFQLSSFVNLIELVVW